MNSTNPLVSIDDDGSNEWDDFVWCHPLGTIYHLSGWKTVIEESFPHIKGKIITVRDRDSHEIIAGLPIYFVKSCLTGKRLVSAPFALFCDPLVSGQLDMEMIVIALMDLYKSSNSDYIEIRTSAPALFLSDVGFASSVYNKTHTLILNDNPETLLKSFHKNSIQALILRASKNKIKVRQAKCASDLVDFYTILLRSRKRLGLPPIPFKFFNMLWNIFKPKKYVTLLLATYGRMVVGATLLLEYKDKVYYEYACDLLEYRRLGVSQMLNWEAIRLSCLEGRKIYNFGRTSVGNKGLLVHKSRWGTKVSDLPKFYYPASFSNKDKTRDSSLQYRIARKVFKHTPLKFSSILGNFIYHHMG